MPFTFSHPAAVLPLAIIPKKWISVTALVIGSITPDFEYFFRMEPGSEYSHTWTGVFWFDLPLALLLVYLFNLIRKELIENLPEFFNRRFSDYTFFDRNLNKVLDFLIVIISLLTGIYSHLIWDRLTHKSVSMLDKQEHYTTFWEFNSIAGAIIIAAAIFKMRKGSKTKKRNILLYWLMISLITAATICVRFFSTSHVRELGISAIVGFLGGLIITSVFNMAKAFYRIVHN